MADPLRDIRKSTVVDLAWKQLALNIWCDVGKRVFALLHSPADVWRRRYWRMPPQQVSENWSFELVDDHDDEDEGDCERFNQFRWPIACSCPICNSAQQPASASCQQSQWLRHISPICDVTGRTPVLVANGTRHWTIYCHFFIENCYFKCDTRKITDPQWTQKKTKWSRSTAFNSNEINFSWPTGRPLDSQIRNLLQVQHICNYAIYSHIAWSKALCDLLISLCLYSFVSVGYSFVCLLFKVASMMDSCCLFW